MTRGLQTRHEETEAIASADLQKDLAQTAAAWTREAWADGLRNNYTEGLSSGE